MKTIKQLKRTSLVVAGHALLFGLLLSGQGCANAEQSAGMVFDNARSVIRSGDEKLWIAPESTPKPKAITSTPDNS